MYRKAARLFAGLDRTRQKLSSPTHQYRHLMKYTNLPKYPRNVRYTPEVQQFRENFQITPIAGSNYQQNTEVATNFKNSAQFAGSIIGDRWRNLRLKIKFWGNVPEINKVRIIVYISKRGGASTWSPTPGYEQTQVPDPTNFIVYSDRTFRSLTDTSHVDGEVSCNLNNLCQWDRNSDNFERNNLKIATVVWTDAGATSPRLNMSYAYYYSNK